MVTSYRDKISKMKETRYSTNVFQKLNIIQNLYKCWRRILTYRELKRKRISNRNWSYLNTYLLKMIKIFFIETF